MHIRVLVSAFLVAVGGRLAIAENAPADFYVAPDGKDTAVGTTPDSPYATPFRAQQAVRELRKANPDKAVTVRLRGGLYGLTAPLRFGLTDSGSAAAPVTWAAYGDEQPVLSGGTRITGWKVGTDGRWTVTLPAVQKGEWNFTQLWVNGERRYRPRMPKAGFFKIDRDLPPSRPIEKDWLSQTGRDRFVYKGADVNPAWRNPADLEVVAFDHWEISRLRVSAINAAERIVQCTGHAISNGPDWWIDHLRGGRNYFMDNVAEALGDPGQWYLDRPTGVLTYIPFPGEDATKAQVIAPRLEQLVIFDPGKDATDTVGHLRFQGLTFAHNDWFAHQPKGFTSWQAAHTVSAAVEGRALTDTIFGNCIFRNLGSYAVHFGGASAGNRIENCLFDDLGAGGVRIGGLATRKDGSIDLTGSPDSGDAATVSHDNTIVDCVFTRGGRVFPAGIGVWIGDANTNTVEHCEVTDYLYTAISVGWTWGFARNNAHHNTIAWNHLQSIGQGLLSDMGGIYTLGVQPGTTLHHNRIHGIMSGHYGGNGIYQDEGSSEIVIENNLVYDTQNVLGFHYGKDNIYRNNIFAFGSRSHLELSKPEDRFSFRLERNIILSSGPAITADGPWGGKDRFITDANVYWSTAGAPVFSKKQLFEDWKKATGNDANSVVADPLFVNAEQRDFTLKPESPALKLGFKPIDLSTVGARPEKLSPQITARLKAIRAAIARPACPSWPGIKVVGVDETPNGVPAQLGGELPKPGGLKAAYYAGTDFGQLIVERQDSAVQVSDKTFNLPDGRTEQLSIRWTGLVHAEHDGVYTLTSTADDGQRITLGGVQLIDDWTAHMPTEQSGTVRLKAGWYPITIEYFQGGGSGSITVWWTPPGGSQRILGGDLAAPPIK